MTNFVQRVSSKFSSIKDIHHGYHEVLIQFKNKIKDYHSLKNELLEILNNLSPTNKSQHNLWTIPIYYGSDMAPDLEEYLSSKNISSETFIKKHTQAQYTVYFVGFLPGFLYLGGMDSSLDIPRKTIPSPLMPKGTVAIGGSHTGIYPQNSPGGWYGIGYTPISFFDIHNKKPIWAKAGDRIKFKAIDVIELKLLNKKIEQGIFELKAENIES